MQGLQPEEEGNRCQYRNPCNLRTPRSSATQMGTWAHSVRPLGYEDTRGTTVILHRTTIRQLKRSYHFVVGACHQFLRNRFGYYYWNWIVTSWSKELTLAVELHIINIHDYNYTFHWFTMYFIKVGRLRGCLALRSEGDYMIIAFAKQYNVNLKI